jgi:hypothetical protein
MPTDLDALAALAREATAGEWFTDRPEVDRFDHVTGHYTTPDRMHVISRVKPDGQEYAVVAITDGADDEANAAYIAAANPAVVLGLIERVQRAEARLGDLTELLAAAEEAIGTITQAMTDNYLKSLGHPTVSQETRMRYTSRLRAAVARVRGE